MREIIIDIGNFTEGQAQAIRRSLYGKSYFKFDITYSNCAGNCTIIAKVPKIRPESDEEIKAMLIYCAFCELARLTK